jgi:molybdopterin converting factor small subunit
MVRIKVRTYSQAIPDHIGIELNEGSSVETLLTQVKEQIKKGCSDTQDAKLAFLENAGSLIVLLNGMSIYSHSGWKTILNDGDEVSFLPMVAGG